MKISITGINQFVAATSAAEFRDQKVLKKDALNRQLIRFLKRRIVIYISF